MQTIETTVVVLPDGSIHIPPRPGLTPGEHRAVLVLEEATQPSASDRDRATAALRAAGLLTELSPEEKARAAASRATLEQVSAVLARGGGPTLSEIVLEMRGPKE